MAIRIGHGFDVHSFGPGNGVTLGGVWIPHEQGLVAHSDGDVLIHALCDALLGALGEGDIGRHFPDTDQRWLGADSRDLLRRVYLLMQHQQFILGNADITLIAESPRIGHHAVEMREKLSADLNTKISRINIKATTTEGLGTIGRKEGIAAHAVVLLESES
ncbi:MAG: 2-C-methyl-D-erythritol 2,4-cyclodiphosphate synthase [Halieaceae bacterium]|jgi:2-C-methyl-D-erythritol 2,4-cyclodiphosphate synthase